MMQIRKPSKHVVGEGNNHEKVLKDTYKALRGNISYGTQGNNPNNPTLGLVTDNISGNFGTVSNSGAADTEFAVTHNLNRVPIGFHVIRQSLAGSFYDSGTAWTTTKIFLKCNAANVAATFFIF
jgi:hypothetical protein